MRGPEDYMLTATGKKLYPLDPRLEDICIEDIAAGLSKQCRFAGQITRFYSTAQHSVMCCTHATPDSALAALLHDASEAYLSDIVRPAKKALPDYLVMEARLEAVIAERFGVPPVMKADIKLLDNRALVTEAATLFPSTVYPWWKEAHWPAPFDVRVMPWGPFKAERKFLEAYERLTKWR